MPTGAGRLYLASGLYLQVGLVLTTARLLKRASPWTWVLFGILLVDVGASYTRGFWIASNRGSGRRSARLCRTVPHPQAVIGGHGHRDRRHVRRWAVGGSLPDYLLQRAASTTAWPASVRRRPARSRPEHPGAVPTPPAEDELGAESNAIRVVQARVLLTEITSSPIVGHGFGATARDYPYGTGFVFELTYLDIAFKTGLLGLILFLSLPIRLLVDAMRAGSAGSGCLLASALAMPRCRPL